MRATVLAVVLLSACGDDGGGAIDAAPGTPDGGGAGPDGGGGEGGTWSEAAPLLGGPRQETGVAGLGGLAWVLGGFDEGGAIVGELASYDAATNTWQERAPFPVGLHHANFAAVGDLLWVVGSLRGLGFTANGEVWSYDPAADAWTERGAMPAGSERGASGVAVVGTKIYLAGGGYPATDAFHAYDTATDQWETLPSLPTPREHLVAVAVGTQVVVIGGRDGIDAHTDRVDLFDVVTGSWSAGAAMPTSRGGMAAAALDGRIYVFGGEGNAGMPSGVFDAVESYDPASDTWMTHTPMRTPRHGTGAARIGTRIVVPGGADVQAFGAVDTVEIFTP